ncbi:hypothetical protein EG359_10300 [Chryseobacterium joostei]|uniref:Uncharacterized protein n=1 Tax=Chryseobacterium joostei TaxID=112234 RepID=A0A1N7KJH2_9FLAO|nr:MULTISPECIES: hypothetical protein [Chryseobacterium]AZA77795.1 hypothetical protein EG347_09830 [Chryseobacterium sp. G0186]AZA99989.1 hypothetical protein EG359_10300 [Chryseobacterium joostei]SIS61697.1 hypothetical protein SAMN05421768_1143 [Chryseobacterium joostei]
MKTPNKSPFSILANEFIENTLEQIVRDYSVGQVFFKIEKHSTRSHILVQLNKFADVAKLRSKRWVKEFRDQYQVYFYFIDYSKLEYQLSKGHPFIEYHCQRSSIIYQNKDSRSSILKDRIWKKYRKKFNRYEDSFHHDHEIRRVKIERLISEDSYNSVFTSFEELIQYDLEYLEELYSGERKSDIDLNQRINQLLIYTPELQSYFVKKNQREYFLNELFAKVKKAIDEDDIIYNTGMFESLRIIEDSLFTLIEARFYELKHLIKKQYEKIYKVDQYEFHREEYPADEILDKAINRILTFTQLEQIYFFHKTTYGEVTTYYLLLIGLNVNNEKVKAITHSLTSIFGKEYKFLLVGHDRYWIQKNLYQYQSFFVFIMQGKNLVFTSDQNHPEPHWEMPNQPQHSDLYFHYKSALQSSLQFYKLIDGEQENYQGVDNIFALFLLSFCRTYIYVKTFYLPNYMTSEALWQLCIYADKDIYKYNYLFEQFSSNIFSFTDYNMSVHHSIGKVDKEKVNCMKMIVKKLMNELKITVIDGKLLDNFKMNFIYDKTENPLLAENN